MHLPLNKKTLIQIDSDACSLRFHLSEHISSPLSVATIIRAQLSFHLKHEVFISKGNLEWLRYQFIRCGLYRTHRARSDDNIQSDPMAIKSLQPLLSIIKNMRTW